MGYVHTSAAGRVQSRVGFNDFNFGAAIKWDWKNFHHYVEIDGWARAGYYRKEDIANPGFNYWSLRTDVRLYLLGGPGLTDPRL